jgi:DNA-binding response OmpR family regulator
MKRRILLVEDEPNLARGLKLNFELEGYEVECAATGAAARAAWEREMPSLVILDVMLPDASGFDLLQEIKHRDARQPVLLLTARAADDDRITGLALGADDYVTKPFNLQELILRVRGLVQRSSWYAEPFPERVRIGEALLTPAQSRLEREGEVFLLTELELALLVYLWRRRGSWVTREKLLVDVWGYAPETETRTVDIFVSRLRRMLGDSGTAPRLLVTKRGLGYCLAGEATGEGPRD